jgi:hypothetical protein
MGTQYIPIPASDAAPLPARASLLVLAFLMQTASLSQLPFLQDNTIAKIGLSVSELCVLLLMLWQMRRSPNLGRWFGIATGLVVLRFFYAWTIGYLRYDITLSGALQEARFGVLIVIAPVAFVLFRTISVHKIGEILLGLVAALILADILVTWFFVRTGYISLGGRGASRYVISVIPMLLFVWVRMIIAIRSGEPLRYRDLGLLLFALAHVALYSTSRTEAILCCSFIGQWIYVRLPHLRWPLLAVVLGIAYISYTSIQPSGDAQIAGRDYRLALAYSRDAFPFGVGLVPEAIQKIQLGTAGNFFASDYGPILLIYRYGMVGIMIGVVILYMWLKFFFRILVIPGTYLVALGVLAYFLVVPLLDYGSMIGGILLGAAAAVMAAASQDLGNDTDAMSHTYTASHAGHPA